MSSAAANAGTMLNGYEKRILSTIHHALFCVSTLLSERTVGPAPKLLIAALMTAALRLYQGGGGVWMGVGVIVTSGGIGIAWRHPGIVTFTLGDKTKEDSFNFISGNTEGLSYE